MKNFSFTSSWITTLSFLLKSAKQSDDESSESKFLIAV
tara:strand:- start:72237 stop:72350 length:114 start_codon:yes stop_codon:yes gene_type:complete